MADVGKELAAITDEVELKTANSDEIESGCFAEADTPDSLLTRAFVLSLLFEPGVIFSMEGRVPAGNPSILSDGSFTSNGPVVAARKSAAGNGNCTNDAGTATGKAGVGEVTGVAVTAVAVVVHTEFFVSLPFLPKVCPSRDLSEAEFGRCRLSCTSPANDAIDAEEVGFAAAVPERAAVPDVTKQMFGLKLDTGCILSGRTAVVRGCNYVSSAAAGAASVRLVANIEKQSR